MDTLTPQQRHTVMSHIRSNNTVPELTVRSALFRLGFRFRKNDRRYSGTPDIVFPHYHAVIFVNGCFFHGHAIKEQTSITSTYSNGGLAATYSRGHCKLSRLPKTNTEYWRNKIERNKQRDKEDAQKLMNDLWRVGVVWECSITGKNRAQKIRNVAEEISLWLEEEFDEPYKEF